MATKAYNPQVVLKNGRPSAVILGIKDYETLLERLEQVEDLKAIRALTKEELRSRSFDDYLKEQDRGLRR